MAERVVSWKIVADFAKTARTAKQAEAALDSLKKKQQEVNAASAAQKVGGNNTTSIKNAQSLAAATDKSTTALTRNATAQQKQVASARAMESALSAGAKAAKEVSQAQEKLTGTTESVARATRTVTADHVRHTRELERHTAATNRARDASGRFVRVLGDVDRTARGSGGGIGGMNNNLGRMEGGWGRNTRGARGFGAALKALLIPVITSAVQELSGALGPLAAAFGGLVGAIGPAAGLLATLPGLLTAAVGGIGTLMAGFAGIGGALKAYGQQRKAVQKSEKAQAKASVSNARAVRNAQESLADARRNQGESARNSARAIESAERSLADAHRNAKQAQEGVTLARKAARQEIEDLKKSLKSLELQEEGASLGLEEARERLQKVRNDPGSTDLERRQAALAVKEAKASLQDIQDQRKKGTKELQQQQRKGIEGSAQVVAAKRAEADASRAVADAERSVSDARRNARQSAADSARAVRNAQEGVQDAMKKTKESTESASDATKVFTEAMKKLTPEARLVVLQLLRMASLVGVVRKAAQRGLMPGVLDFLKSAVSLFPIIFTFVSKTARALGDFASKLGKGLASASGMKKFAQVLDGAYKIIKLFLVGAYDLGGALVNITIAAQGLTEWLVKTTNGWARTWKAMSSGEAGQRRLIAFFDETQRVASQLGRIIGNVAKAIYGFGKGTQGVGRWILDAFENMTEGWATFANSVSGQRFLIDWGNRAKPVLTEIARLFGALVDAIQQIGKQADLANLLAQIRTGLLPALVSVIAVISQGFLQRLVQVATNLAEIVTAIGRTGILTAFATALVGISEGLAAISRNNGAVAVLVGLGAVVAGFGAIVAASRAYLLLGRAATMVVGALNKARAAFGLLEISARQMWVALGPVGIAIGTVTAVLAYFISRHQEAKERVKNLTDALRENNGVLDEQARKEQVATLTKEGYYQAAKDLGISIETATKAYWGEADALKEVNAKLAEADSATKDGTGASIRREQAAGQLADTIKRGSEEYKKAKTAADALRAADEASLTPSERAARARALNAEATRDETEAKRRIVAVIDAARRAQEAETNAVNAHRTALLQLRGGQRALNASARALKDVLEENGRVFDKNGNALKGMNEKADRSQEALDNMAGSAIDLAQQMRENGKSEDEVAEKLKSNRNNWIRTAMAMGISEDNARKLAKQLFDLPERTETQVEVADREAKESVKEFKDSIKKLPKNVRMAIKAYDDTPEGLKAAKKAIETWKSLNPEMQQILIEAGVELDFNSDTAASLRKKAQALINGKKVAANADRHADFKAAEGGYITGPGTTTSDSIPALLSDQEFVQNAKATSYYGVDFMHALNSRRIPKGDLPRFARGGKVSRSNRLAGGGQAKSGSGGGYSVTLSAGIDTSKLAASVDKAMRAFAPLVGAMQTLAKNVAGMGKSLNSSIPRLNAFGNALRNTFARINGYLNAPLIAAVKAALARLNAFYTNAIGWINRLLTYINSRWTTKVTALLVNPFKPVPGQIATLMGAIRDRLNSGITALAPAWNRLEKIAAKPIVFIIDTVINDGLIGAYNHVAKALNVGSISRIGKPRGLAGGGKVPGYAVGGRIRGGPGRGHGTSDSVLGIDGNGVPTARVSAGEFVVPEKQTRKYFPLLERMRKGISPYAEGGAVHGATERRKRERGGDGDYLAGYAGGGLLGRIAGHLPGFFLGGVKPHPATPRRHSGYPWARWAGDFPSGAGGTPPIRAWGPGRVSSTRTLAGSYGKHMRIDHGTSETLYAHLSAILAKAGSRVAGGQTIARGGWSGNVQPRGPAGAHLHFELKGSGKGGGGGGKADKQTGSAVNVPKVINYLDQFREKAAGALDDLKSAALDSPIGKLAEAAGRKAYSLMDNKVESANSKQMAAARRAAAAARRAAAEMAADTSDDPASKSTKASGSGRPGAAAAARRLGASPVSYHNDPSGYPSFDAMIQSKAEGNSVASHLKSNHARYKMRYLIWNMKIASGTRNNWAWRPYTPITRSGDYRHVNHVHTSFYARGTNSAKRGPAVVGENGPELLYMKGGERVVSNKNSGLPRYNTGGIVNKVKPGATGDWVKALQYAVGQKQSGTWGGDLSTALMSREGNIDTPKMPKNPSKAWKARWKKWVQALEGKLGVKKDGKWDYQSIKNPLKHIIAHAFKWKVGEHGHTSYDDHPWAKYTATEKAIREQVRTNKLNAEWDKYLAQFGAWGFDSLVRKMTDLGTGDGMALARLLSKDQKAAKDFNDQLTVQYNRDDANSSSDSKAAKLNMVIKSVGAGTETDPVGLQGAATAAGLSLDSTAALYEQLRTMPNWNSISPAKRSRFEKDILDFQNLFKFATGGSVPGHGNGDRVHALLEPGEFILRKSAVGALTKKFGAGALGMLNNADRYANGGFIAGGMEVPNFVPASVRLGNRRSQTSETSGTGNTYNFNTTVNNPTLEDGAVSVQKRVTRVARTGILA